VWDDRAKGQTRIGWATERIKRGGTEGRKKKTKRSKIPKIKTEGTRSGKRVITRKGGIEFSKVQQKEKQARNANDRKREAPNFRGLVRGSMIKKTGKCVA